MTPSVDISLIRDCYALWLEMQEGKVVLARHGKSEAQRVFSLAEIREDSMIIRRWVEEVHAYGVGCTP